MATIKFKRTTGSNAPATMDAGELAYAEGSNKLFIGTSAGNTAIKTVIDGSITQPASAGSGTKVILKESDAANANSLTLTAPAVDSSYTLTLPAANPASTKSLQVSSNGTMSYGEPSAGNVGDVGDVTSGGISDNDFLVYDGTNWVGTDSGAMKALVGVTNTSDVEYQDVTVTGTLDVTGNTLADATTQLTIQDQMIELGIGNSTDAAASGGGIVIPGITQKKLQWVDGSGWQLVGGDLKVDSGDDSGTAINVAGSDVIKITVKTIVANEATPGDGEIKLEDAIVLHNYNSESVGQTIDVGVVDGSYTITGEIIGDFDFGDF